MFEFQIGVCDQKEKLGYYLSDSGCVLMRNALRSYDISLIRYEAEYEIWVEILFFKIFFDLIIIINPEPGPPSYNRKKKKVRTGRTHL